MAEEPDCIGPDYSPRRTRTFGDKARAVVKAFTTKQGLVGHYDYGFLFRPNLPFMKKSTQVAPFFGLNEHMPVLLALLLGFQHALSMLAGIITPPIIMAGSSGVNLDSEYQSYLVSTSLIVSGILSSIQITRFHIHKTPYYLGTGLISVVGTSFATITVASGAFSQMYSTGYCPTDSGGNRLPCPKGYGALVGTSAVCGLLEVLLSFAPPKVLKKIFPPLVTGPVVTLIGVSLIQSAFENWAGGSGSCMSRPSSGAYALCPNTSAPHALPWGSAEFIGLGFLVLLTIVLCERFGSPIMQSCSVIVGLLTGCIVGAACGYFSHDDIDSAPAVSFVWVKTFPLSVHGPIVLPLLAVYVVLAMEATGDITATCDVSRLEVDGPLFDSRIQGGILADGINGIIAGLCTITPMSTFAQNNGVIALTRCANRKAGYACCFFLVVAGVFAKFAGALVSIPDPIIGGMTTFLFSSVAVSGLRIIGAVPFTRRNRFILTAAVAPGFGAVLVPSWFSYVFTYSGSNQAKLGFFDAIELVMETGFAVTGFVAMILNLVLPEDDIGHDAASITAPNDAGERQNQDVWSKLDAQLHPERDSSRTAKDAAV